MYELGALGDFANLFFSIVGIWMVHHLYKSTRKRWQTILAWALGYAVWTFGTHPLNWLIPWVSYERAAMIIGFTGIFIHLYLFSDIPKAQCIFTYFMQDTSMTLVVLLARTLSVFFAPYIPINTDITFLMFYFPMLIGFMFLFYYKLRKIILDALVIFKHHLTILAVFAAIGYITLLLLVDPWSPWEALDVWGALKWIGVITLIVIGYIICFYTLTSIKNQTVAETEKQNMSKQIKLFEKYYASVVEGINQARSYNHDLRYHINALNGLCAAEDLEGVKNYISDMEKELSSSIPNQYCSIGAVNALLEHYAQLCRRKNIDFRCMIQIPADTEIMPIHLCVIFGNALQNALEAQDNTNAGDRYIELKTTSSNGKLVISVSNPCSIKPRQNADGAYITSKTESGHGIGINSIETTAARYNGWSRAVWEDGIFSLQTVLNCK